MESKPPANLRVLEPAMIAEIEEMVPAAERGTFLGEIFGLFANTAPTSLVEIKQAIAKADGKALEQHAHRLKGSCLSIGAVALAHVCEALEQAGRSGQVTPALLPQLEQMNTLFDATKAELAVKLKSYAA